MLLDRAVGRIDDKLLSILSNSSSDPHDGGALVEHRGSGSVVVGVDA
jgi:hypothetical protein